MKKKIFLVMALFAMCVVSVFAQTRYRFTDYSSNIEWANQVSYAEVQQMSHIVGVTINLNNGKWINFSLATGNGNPLICPYNGQIDCYAEVTTQNNRGGVDYLLQNGSARLQALSNRSEIRVLIYDSDYQRNSNAAAPLWFVLKL